jgi:hypothetical protein
MVQWPLEYVKGSPPVNTDDTPHKCPNFNTAGTPFVQKPAPVAAPAPIGNATPDHPVPLGTGLAGGLRPNPGNAAGAIPDKNADALLREMAQALARIALNSNDIVNMLARIEKMVSPAPYNEENGPV